MQIEMKDLQERKENMERLNRKMLTVLEQTGVGSPSSRSNDSKSVMQIDKIMKKDSDRIASIRQEILDHEVERQQSRGTFEQLKDISPRIQDQLLHQKPIAYNGSPASYIDQSEGQCEGSLMSPFEEAADEQEDKLEASARPGKAEKPQQSQAKVHQQRHVQDESMISVCQAQSEMNQLAQAY